MIGKFMVTTAMARGWDGKSGHQIVPVLVGLDVGERPMTVLVDLEPAASSYAVLGLPAKLDSEAATAAALQPLVGKTVEFWCQSFAVNRNRQAAAGEVIRIVPPGK